MISRRKSSLRLSGMSIFSSIDRISRSSGSSGWPVNLFLTFSRWVYAFTLSM